MNFDIFLRHLPEFAVLIPAAVFALVPVRRHLRYNVLRTFIIALGISAVLIGTGSLLCTFFQLETNLLLLPIAALLFVIYCFSVDLSLSKKLLCLLNSMMMCSFSGMYIFFLMAPTEIGNNSTTFNYPSSFATLALAGILGLIHSRALAVWLPVLLDEDYYRPLWKYLLLVPLGFTIYFYWIIPTNAEAIMVGRARIVILVQHAFLPLLAALLYRMMWWMTMRLYENKATEEENTLLRMENRHYKELQSYVQETRAIRHDYRQHLRVMQQLNSEGKTEELSEYISQLDLKTSPRQITFCQNTSISAIASYYNETARSKQVKIAWELDLPAELPMSESDYCAIFGNLLENALTAVSSLPEEKRRIHVISALLTDSMIGISVDNPYEGKIRFGTNGLPLSSKKGKGHGIGLLSVSNIVQRQHGTMNVKAANGIFTVDILLYC